MPTPKLPTLPRIAAKANPWGVALVDVRPITLGMLSTTSDPSIALTFGQMCVTDGREFIEAARAVARTETLAVSFATDDSLTDGALFNPTVMEDKWALFLQGGMLIGVRSWDAVIGCVADVVREGDALVSRSYGGALFQGLTPERSARSLEFLVRSLALSELLPVPLASEEKPKGSSVGLLCMSEWGRAAQFATHEPITYVPNPAPLRSKTVVASNAPVA